MSNHPRTQSHWYEPGVSKGPMNERDLTGLALPRLRALARDLGINPDQPRSKLVAGILSKT